MPDTHDLGPIFVQSIWLRDDSPMFHLAPTFELESPYRESKSLVVRSPFSRRAFVFGWWRKTGRTEDEALTAAVGSVKSPVDPYANRYGTSSAMAEIDEPELFSDLDDPTTAPKYEVVNPFPELAAMDMKDYKNNRERLRKTFSPDRLNKEMKFGWFKPINIIGFKTVLLSSLNQTDDLNPVDTTSITDRRKAQERFNDRTTEDSAASN